MLSDSEQNEYDLKFVEVPCVRAQEDVTVAGYPTVVIRSDVSSMGITTTSFSNVVLFVQA